MTVDRACRGRTSHRIVGPYRGRCASEIHRPRWTARRWASDTQPRDPRLDAVRLLHTPLLERETVVDAAVRASRGRVSVVAQSNHPSARLAADIARRNAQLGADVISFAIPRVFALPNEDLIDYCRTICDAVDLPVLIQDFNPGGSTIDAEFCAHVNEVCPNFRYVKLEEPLMGRKVEAIRSSTDDRVGVLEGWGGQYLLELIPVRIRGSMPGLGVADVLAQVWRLGRARRHAGGARCLRGCAPADRLQRSCKDLWKFCLSGLGGIRCGSPP